MITDFPFEFNIPQECAFLPMFKEGPCFLWKSLSGSNIQVEERIFVLCLLANGLWPPMMKIELELYLTEQEFNRGCGMSGPCTENFLVTNSVVFVYGNLNM